MKASKRTLVFVAGGLGVLAFSGWVAKAQIGANGTVLGCVGNSGIIRGVDETTGTCRSGDTALSWYTKAGADASFDLIWRWLDEFGRHTHAKVAILEGGLASLQDTVDALGARADGPCFDNTNRYVDCGNGTVTDTVTGLIWLKQWDCLPSDTWAAANHTVARLKDSDCSLTDKSSPGDWRLPTKAEWEATMARAGALGCVDPGGSRLGGLSLTNDAGTGCYVTGGSSFADLEASAFWSSSAAEIGPHNAWAALLNSGFVGLDSKSSGLTDVWPVRGGPR